MDPAALGTTIIGLDTVRQDEARYQRAQALELRRPQRTLGVRRQLAASLRWTARRIDPVPASAG
jgi:hypothetical protein